MVLAILDINAMTGIAVIIGLVVVRVPLSTPPPPHTHTHTPARPPHLLHRILHSTYLDINVTGIAMVMSLAVVRVPPFTPISSLPPPNLP